ncbi:MAG: 30S ribosome-binding factor RbfA [Kiritimatiellae bacterium]|nr:30S ribosome-binding factor RbfA [Kiritimatiellia bacterium]
MSEKRMVRVNELIKRTLAEHMHRVLGASGFDLVAATITRVKTSPDLRDAYVHVSILGHEGERDDMIRFLDHHRKDFQADLGRSVRLRYTPRLWFRLDESIEKGDHVLGIMAEIERETPLNAEEPTPETDGEERHDD